MLGPRKKRRHEAEALAHTLATANLLHFAPERPKIMSVLKSLCTRIWAQTCFRFACLGVVCLLAAVKEPPTSGSGFSLLSDTSKNRTVRFAQVFCGEKNSRMQQASLRGPVWDRTEEGRPDDLKRQRKWSQRDCGPTRLWNPVTGPATAQHGRVYTGLTCVFMPMSSKAVCLLPSEALSFPEARAERSAVMACRHTYCQS